MPLQSVWEPIKRVGQLHAVQVYNLYSPRFNNLITSTKTKLSRIIKQAITRTAQPPPTELSRRSVGMKGPTPITEDNSHPLHRCVTQLPSGRAEQNFIKLYWRQTSVVVFFWKTDNTVSLPIYSIPIQNRNANGSVMERAEKG